MARPPRLNVPGALFHVTQRGNDRRAIFLDDQDRLRYLGRLGQTVGEEGVRLHAYCLLSNHVHLLLQSGDRPLSELMQRLGTSYARAFNGRWVHSGHLFQGRYFASLIKSDAHLLTVIRYIHLNPMRAGLVENPAHHRWSSHRAYLGEAAPPWLFTALVRAILGATAADFHTAYAQLMEEDVEDESIQPCALDAPSTTTEPGARVSLDQILEEVAARTGCGVEEICGSNGGHRVSRARFAVVLLARTMARTTFSELARVLGRDAATLCNGVARRTQRSSPDWEALIEGARRSLSLKKEKGNA